MITAMNDDGAPALHPDRVSHGYHHFGHPYPHSSGLCRARFLHRHWSRDLWSDDWTIAGALIFGVGVFVSNILISSPLSRSCGLPHHGAHIRSTNDLGQGASIDRYCRVCRCHGLGILTCFIFSLVLLPKSSTILVLRCPKYPCFYFTDEFSPPIVSFESSWLSCSV
jgi:hypothetical protein